MKTIVLFIISLLFFIGCGSDDAIPESGGKQSTAITNEETVRVLNSENVGERYVSSFPFGGSVGNRVSYSDRCSIIPGGIITVLGEIDGDNFLVEYTAPPSVHKMVIQPCCPSEVVFSLPKASFYAMVEDCQSKILTEQRRKEQIQEIHRLASQGKSDSMSGKFVINIHPLEITILNEDLIVEWSYSLGNICWLRPMDKITVLGELNKDTLLVECTNFSKPLGAECPNGTVFTVSKSDFLAEVALQEAQPRIQAEYEFRENIEKIRQQAKE